MVKVTKKTTRNSQSHTQTKNGKITKMETVIHKKQSNKEKKKSPNKVL